MTSEAIVPLLSSVPHAVRLSSVGLVAVPGGSASAPHAVPMAGSLEAARRQADWEPVVTFLEEWDDLIAFARGGLVSRRSCGRETGRPRAPVGDGHEAGGVGTDWARWLGRCTRLSWVGRCPKHDPERDR
jgi:hypothetical protein